MLTRIVQWYHRQQRAQALARIRSTFEFFGFSVDEFSDEELEQLLMETSRILSKVGFTTDEIAEAARLAFSSPESAEV